MMLLGLHIFAISAIVSVVGGIGFYVGKKEGIRLTKNYFEQLSSDSVAAGHKESTENP